MYIHGPFMIRIIDFPKPRAFEKPPMLKFYDGYGDRNKYMEHINTVLNYYQVHGVVN